MEHEPFDCAQGGPLSAEADAKLLGQRLQVLFAAHQDVFLARETEGGLAEAGPGDELEEIGAR
jgi:hypothetical protein